MTSPPRLSSSSVRLHLPSDGVTAANRRIDTESSAPETPLAQEAPTGATFSDLLQREVAHGNPKLLDFVAQLLYPAPGDEPVDPQHLEEVHDRMRDAMALGASVIAGVNALPALVLSASSANLLFRECAASVGADSSSFSEGTRKQIDACFGRTLGESTSRSLPVSVQQAQDMMRAAIVEVLERGAEA